MPFFDALNSVENDKSFSVGEAYLAHGFRIFTDVDPEEWQIGYYDAEKDSIIVYTYKDGLVTASPPSEVYKETGKIAPLIRRDIKLSPEEALEVAHKHFNEKYASHGIMKTILLLQTLPIGQVYNITIVTESFNLNNLKLDTKDGKVLHESFDSIMSLKQD